ncbi:MAG: DUF4870 domain-containing protein [Patescibacteria group bacterium]
MDDDNVIKPNQDFQIPPTTADSQAVNGTQGAQDSNSTQNVNNDDSSKQGVVDTQTPVPPTDSEPIKINDPYDFVLGNKNTTTPEPNISQVTSTDNPLQSKPLDNTSELPPLESNSSNIPADNTQSSSAPTGLPNVNIPTDSVQNKESSGPRSQDSSTLGSLDYSQGTATADNIPTNNAPLSGVVGDDVDKNKAEINDVLNSALSMDNFKNLNKPIEPQEVPDPYTNVTSPSPDGSQSTNPSYTTVNSETPSQSATINGNTYQNPDFVNPSNDTNLPPIPNQNPQQGSFSQTAEGTFINPYATSQANATPTNDQTQGAQVQGQTQNADTPPDRSEDIFGVVSYVIGLNILMLIYSYLRNDKFLKFHAVQSIGFNLVFIVIFLVFTSLSRGSLSLAFLIANVVLFIVWVLLSILLMYKAYQGEKYPFIFFGMLANKLS